MSKYFSDKRIKLEALKNHTLGKLELLEEVEKDFKKGIEHLIKISKEVDGSGNVWINSNALLEELGLEEWNSRLQKDLVNRIEEIKEINKDEESTDKTGKSGEDRK